MNKNLISVNDLAMSLNVSDVVVELFAKSLFNEVPVNGFTKAQAAKLKYELINPFAKTGNEINKIIEETADMWLRKELNNEY